MKTTYWMALSLSLLSLAVPAGAADEELAKSLRAVVEQQISAYNAKDASGVLQTIHTRSPDYDSMRAALPQQFANENVKATLVDFRYMGHDDEFAVARVKTKVEGPAGSGFQNNVVDEVVLFHREGPQWKIWSDDVLGVYFE